MRKRIAFLVTRILSKILIICRCTQLEFEENNDMPVPDNVVFGSNEEGKPITYGQLRAIEDPSQRIELLRNRIKNFLLDQVHPLKNSSPFPLAVMCCIGMEMLGQIAINNNNDDASFQFVEIAKKLSPKFAQQLKKEAKEQLAIVWPENNEISKINNLAKLLFTYFRNSMIHGYQAKGVYLTVEDTTSFEYNEDGYLIINPKWMWDKFLDIFEETFHEIKNSQANNGKRKNCLKYIAKLLK